MTNRSTNAVNYSINNLVTAIIKYPLMIITGIIAFGIIFNEKINELCSFMNISTVDSWLASTKNGILWEGILSKLVGKYHRCQEIAKLILVDFVLIDEDAFLKFDSSADRPSQDGIAAFDKYLSQRLAVDKSKFRRYQLKKLQQTILGR